MESSLRRNIFPMENWDSFLEEGKKEFHKLNGLTFSKEYSAADFDFIKTIGTGAFGRVFLATSNRNGNYFALKVLDKAHLVKTEQVIHTLNEKSILQAINFPFCVRLEMAFQDNSYLYMCFPFIPGGEMFTLLRKMKKFQEPHSRFYGAQVLLAFEYLHYLDMVYRDLKPENILIDSKGYIKLTDFGFCKIVEGRTYTVCGTPEYMAPEIIAREGYGKAVDWWAYGILLFEMSAGYPPFHSETHMKIYEKVTAGKYRTPRFFSAELAHLINNILQVDLNKRYGNLVNGIRDIKDHSWYKSVDWLALFNGTVEPPYLPNVLGPGDARNYMAYEEIELKTAKNPKFVKEFEKF